MMAKAVRGTSVIMVLLCIVMSFDEFMNSCSHEVHVLHQEGKCQLESHTKQSIRYYSYQEGEELALA